MFAISIAMLAAFVVPAQALQVEAPFVPVRILDDNGELLLEQVLEPSNPLLIKTTHYYRLGEVDSAAKGGKPGGGGGGPGTDCTSTAYRTTGWHWNVPYNAYSASYGSIANTAGNTWDSATGANILGGISNGNQGTAGTYDGVNQLAWVSLGASSTIAVTTTWSYRGSGEAVESDGQYNTYYSWSTSGAAGSMDVQHIATHEIGHTFGLDHPNGGGASCLTMYAYTSAGQTYARTLGDGDILGIRAIYGA